MRDGWIWGLTGLHLSSAVKASRICDSVGERSASKIPFHMSTFYSIYTL